jgi:hypothetical protein
MTQDTRFGELRSILANPPTPENIKALRILISNASHEAAPMRTFKELDTWCMSSPMFNYIVHHFAHSTEWRRAYWWTVGDRPSTLVDVYEALTRRDLRRARNTTGVGQGGECIIGTPDVGNGWRGRDNASFTTALLGAEVGQMYPSPRRTDEMLWSHTAPLILAMDPQAAPLVQLIGDQIAICAALTGGRPRGEQAQESWGLIDAALTVYEGMKRAAPPADYKAVVFDETAPTPDDGGPWLALVMWTIAHRAGSINGLMLAAWFKALSDRPAQRTLGIPFDDYTGRIAREAMSDIGAGVIADIRDIIGTIWVQYWQDRLAA